MTIEIESTETTLRAVIEDDGIGGAVVGGGTGLTGLIDRIDALGGTLELGERNRRRNTDRDRAALTAPGSLSRSCPAPTASEPRGA